MSTPQTSNYDQRYEIIGDMATDFFGAIRPHSPTRLQTYLDRNHKPTRNIIGINRAVMLSGSFTGIDADTASYPSELNDRLTSVAADVGNYALDFMSATVPLYIVGWPKMVFDRKVFPMPGSDDRADAYDFVANAWAPDYAQRFTDATVMKIDLTTPAEATK